MNNKKLGTNFELQLCALLAAKGYWVHFIVPDARGAQPFDIIAVKDNNAIAIDAKTLSDKEKYFRIERLEDNQIFAFEKWLACGNSEPLVVVKWKKNIYWIKYSVLKENKKINMEGLKNEID